MNKALMQKVADAYPELPNLDCQEWPYTQETLNTIVGNYHSVLRQVLGDNSTHTGHFCDNQFFRGPDPWGYYRRAPQAELLDRLNTRLRGEDPGKPINWKG